MRARRKRRRAMATKIRDVAGPAVAAAFDRMAIAEAELARFGGRDREPPGIFLALQPPPALIPLALEVYRAHARELVDRALEGADLSPATAAEIVAACSSATLVAPPRAAFAAVYEAAFLEVFPDAELPGTAPREEWPGQVAEDLGELRRRLGDPSRKIDIRSKKRSS